MQVKKVGVRRAIIVAATDEFLAKGFLGTNMREIAARAGCSLSNLYTYFDNKDDLFQAIVESTIAAIERVFDRFIGPDAVASPDELHRAVAHHAGFQHSTLRTVIGFIDHHRNYLRLLLLRSEGSAVGKYTNRLVERYAELCARSAASLTASDRLPVSHFFLRNVCSFYLTTLEDMLKRDLSRHEMSEYAEEMLRYCVFGFMSLLNPQLERQPEAESVMVV